MAIYKTNFRDFSFLEYLIVFKCLVMLQDSIIYMLFNFFISKRICLIRINFSYTHSFPVLFRWMSCYVRHILILIVRVFFNVNFDTFSVSFFRLLRQYLPLRLSRLLHSKIKWCKHLICRTLAQKIFVTRLLPGYSTFFLIGLQCRVLRPSCQLTCHTMQCTAHDIDAIPSYPT